MACKKDRTCTCTHTKTGTSTTQGKVEQVFLGFPFTLADTSFTNPVNEIQIYDKKIIKVTKQTAKKNCVSYSQPYTETTLTSVPAASFNLSVIVTNKGEEKYDCTLK